MLLKDLTDRQIRYLTAIHCMHRTYCIGCPLYKWNLHIDSSVCLLRLKKDVNFCLKQQNTVTIDDKLLE